MSTPTIKDIRAAAAARRQKRQRRRRYVLVMVGLIVVIGGGGFFGIAPVIKLQVESRGSALLKRYIAVDRVTFNPLTLTTTLEGVAVADHDGSPLFSWRRLVVDGGLWSTLTGAWSAESIELDGFAGRLAVDVRGRLNIADVIEGMSGDGSDSRPLDIGQLTVTDAQLVWSDASRTRPFETTFGPVTFSLFDFHTKSDPNSPYEFEAMTESGESLVWDGTLSMSPLRSEGRLAVRGLLLSKYAPYLDELAPLEFTSGIIDASSDYSIDWVEEALSYRLSQGDISVRDLTVNSGEASSEPQSLSLLDVSGLEIDSVNRTSAVERIKIAGGSVVLNHDTEGLKWMGVSLGSKNPSSFRTESDDGFLGSMVLQEVQMEQISFRFSDNSMATPVEFNGGISKAEMRELDLADLSRAAKLELEATLAPAGTISISGSTALKPFAPDFELELKTIELADLAAYLPDSMGVQSVRGTASTQGKLSGELSNLRFEGGAQWDDLWVLDSRGEDLGGVRSLLMSDISISEKSELVRLSGVEIREPKVYFRILENGNWSTASDEVAPPPKIEFEASRGVQWEVSEISISAGHFALRDESLAQPMDLALHDISGTLAGLSSRDETRAEVELDGLIAGETPVSIKGDLNPLGRSAFADLKIQATKVKLSPFSGYTSRFLGYEVTDGDMSLDIDFKMRGQEIESEAVTVLNQVGLGEKIPGSGATKLPIKFAIALLENADGEIVVNVPVSGSMEDPEFQLGRVVWRAFSNRLSQAVSAPFAILSGSPEDEGEAMEWQNHAFAAGEASLSESVARKLEKLGGALRARPALAVDIVGGYQLEDDRDALRSVALEQELRSRASPASFDTNGEWNQQVRVGLLVGLYQEVFQEMPVDLNGALPPESPPELPPENLIEEQTAEEQEARTLMAWLRKVFLPGGKSIESPEEFPVSDEPESLGSFPVPEGLRTELAVLPVEEMIGRLLPEQEVDEHLFHELARARSEAVRDHLIGAGVGAERLTVTGVQPQSVSVTLSLR